MLELSSGSMYMADRLGGCKFKTAWNGEHGGGGRGEGGEEGVFRYNSKGDEIPKT